LRGIRSSTVQDAVGQGTVGIEHIDLGEERPSRRVERLGVLLDVTSPSSTTSGARSRTEMIALLGLRPGQ
jgi:hypothetical protein